MATNLFSKAELKERIGSAFQNPERLAQLLGDVTLPQNLKTWLTRLMLLHGAPIHYLVPDEAMLPPESIRFFYVDMNWVDAMVDGAFSIGRNLTKKTPSPSAVLDQVALPKVKAQMRTHAPSIRAKAFGVAPADAKLQTISGFLLRSSVVQSYPGIAVLAYPAAAAEGIAPDPLPLLRFEQLGPQSDTLLCLVDGDIFSVEIHEPAEQLHYGVDSYKIESGRVVAKKKVHKFHREGDAVRIDPNYEEISLDDCFRPASPRTMKMTTVAKAIAKLNGIDEINSAEMGFEMTEGVGMATFLRRTS